MRQTRRGGGSCNAHASHHGIHQAEFPASLKLGEALCATSHKTQRDDSNVRLGARSRASHNPTSFSFRQKRLKVLQVVEATFAGVGRHVLDLCAELLARGHEVHLAYSEVRMEDRFQEGIRGLVGLRSYRLNMARGPSPQDANAVLHLRRYVRQYGPFDVIHGHSSKAGAIARLASLGLGASRVYTAHALRTADPDLTGAQRVLYTAVERLLGKYFTDAFIGVAQQEADEARRLGVSTDRLHVLPNGITMPPLPERSVVRRIHGIGQDDICLMWVGRLAPQKAPERFAQLFTILAAEAPRVQGVMIGSGPLETHLRALIRGLGLSDRLRLVKDQHAVRSMPAGDIYVMTSRYEGLPYVLLEAQAAGLPVVAFEVGGLATAIEHGATGFAIGQNDEASFLEALRRLVADGDLRGAMGRAALRRAQGFRLDAMVDRTEALYQRLSGEHPDDATAAI